MTKITVTPDNATETTARAGQANGQYEVPPLLTAYEVSQRGQVVGEGVGPSLAGFFLEQGRWLLGEYLAFPTGYTDNLSITSRSLLTRIASRARKANRVAPVLSGPIFPASDWRLYRGKLPPYLWVKAGRGRESWAIIYLSWAEDLARRPITLVGVERSTLCQT